MQIRRHIWHLVGIVSIVVTGVLLLGRYEARSVQPSGSSSVLTEGFKEGVSFFTLYHEGTPVGQIQTKRMRKDSEGFQYDVSTDLRLTAMGQSLQITASLSAHFDRLFGLDHVDFSMESGPTSARGHARVQGEELVITLDTGGTKIEHAIPFDRHLVLSSLLGPRITADALKPGDIRSLNVFDPLTQTVRKTKITAVAYEDINILDRSIKTLKVRQETMGVVLNGWVDKNGEMVRQELGLGLIAQQEPKAVAQHHASSKDGRVDLISQVMIQVENMPSNPEMLPEIRYRLKGLNSSQTTENTARQSWDGDVMTVRKEVLPSAIKFTRRSAIVEQNDVLYQSSHPQVQELADELSKDASTVQAVIQASLDWFSANIKQEAVASIPSALETLRTRRGDCNEHAFLFAGLMRAMGIETRVVAGVAYVPKYKKFGYHAWNEIRIQEAFVTVDPTWQQFPADVTHIALIKGGLEAQIQLWSVMGRLQIEVDSGAADAPN